VSRAVIAFIISQPLLGSVAAAPSPSTPVQSKYLQVKGEEVYDTFVKPAIDGGASKDDVADLRMLAQSHAEKVAEHAYLMDTLTHLILNTDRSDKARMDGVTDRLQELTDLIALSQKELDEKTSKWRGRGEEETTGASQTETRSEEPLPDALHQHRERLTSYWAGRRDDLKKRVNSLMTALSQKGLPAAEEMDIMKGVGDVETSLVCVREGAYVMSMDTNLCVALRGVACLWGA